MKITITEMKNAMDRNAGLAAMHLLTIYTSVFSRTSYKWGHTPCSLLIWLSSLSKIHSRFTNIVKHVSLNGLFLFFGLYSIVQIYLNFV